METYYNPEDLGNHVAENRLADVRQVADDTMRRNGITPKLF